MEISPSLSSSHTAGAGKELRISWTSLKVSFHLLHKSFTVSPFIRRFVIFIVIVACEQLWRVVIYYEFNLIIACIGNKAVAWEN